MKRSLGSFCTVVSWAVLCIVLAHTGNARAHCDTLNGPVIADARVALQKGDVTLVLKWVRMADEQEIKDAFAKALAVRKQSPEATELADRYFFETLVRVHRAGEGAPFTGLKGDEEAVAPGIEGADAALTSGKIEAVEADVVQKIKDGIHKRFERVRNDAKHKDDSVQAGREYVEAYVDYIHFVEGLYDATSASAAHEHEHHTAEQTHAK